MLKMFSRHSPQRLIQRCLVAWLLGTVLWSSSVAIAAAAMGCCDQPQACCTVGAALSCATCVPPLSAPSAQPGALPAGPVAGSVSPYPVRATPAAHTDIWRPPMALAA